MIDLSLLIAIFSGIIIPTSAVGFYIIKGLITKAKYHTLLETRLDKLVQYDKSAIRNHEDYDNRLTILEERVKELCNTVEQTKSWIRLILDHLKIPYPKSKNS